MSFGRRKIMPEAVRRMDATPQAPRTASTATAENTDPIEKLRHAGRTLFDYVYRSVRDEKGARIEDVIGILASNGGFACIFGVLHFLDGTGRTPESVGMVTARDAAGETYYFGDLPNTALLESELALLSLAWGAAQANGAQLSKNDSDDVLRHVASTIKAGGFGEPRLSRNHMPRDLPINYVEGLWLKLAYVLDLCEVPVTRRSAAFGFAIQQAIDISAQVLDPFIAARIAAECAVPMAKLDPKRFGFSVQAGYNPVADAVRRAGL